VNEVGRGLEADAEARVRAAEDAANVRVAQTRRAATAELEAAEAAAQQAAEVVSAERQPFLTEGGARGGAEAPAMLPVTARCGGGDSLYNIICVCACVRACVRESWAQAIAEAQAAAERRAHDAEATASAQVAKARRAADASQREAEARAVEAERRCALQLRSVRVCPAPDLSRASL
jgi:hypothetical protein